MSTKTEKPQGNNTGGLLKQKPSAAHLLVENPKDVTPIPSLKRKQPDNEKQDDDSSGGGRRKPKSGSYLADDSKPMERRRREIEKQALRERFGVSVEATKHSEEERAIAPQGEKQNDILEHEFLNRQIFDGASPEVSMIPANDPEALDEFNKAQEEQKEQLQYRLGLGQNPKIKPPQPGR